jgi:hypothetical protein
MITSDFAAYAVKIDVHFQRPVPAAEIQAQVEGLMTKITLGCLKAGAGLIGHIKCIVETPGQGFLAISVTNHEGVPMTKGQLEEGIGEMDVIINVLLYGLSRRKIQDLVDPLARKGMTFPGAVVEVEDLEKAPGHEHDHEHECEHDHEDHDHC